MQIIFALYLLCNVFFITNNFLFWGDWGAAGNSFNDTFEFYLAPGASLWTILFCEIIYHIPPVVARWIVFLMYFATAICLNEILLHFKVKRSVCFLVVALYTLNPVITAKYPLIDASYYFSQFLFFLASYFVLCKRQKIYYRIISFFLYFLSFSMMSLLCFYAVPFLALIYDEFFFEKKHAVNHLYLLYKDVILLFLKKYSIFLFVPFLFWIYKCLCLNPTGAYEGYNSINFVSMLNFLPRNFMYSLWSIYGYIFSSPVTKEHFCTYFLFFLFFVFLVDKKIFLYLVLSLFVFLFSLIAYFAVNKLGSVGITVVSRHFMLTPLPTAFCIYSAISFFVKHVVGAVRFVKLRKFFFVIIWGMIICCFSFLNLQAGKNIMEDTILSESVIENYMASEVIRDNECFALTQDFGEHGGFLQEQILMNYRSFGLFWYAFGNEKHVSYNTKYESPLILKWYYEHKNDFEDSAAKFWKIRDISGYEPTYNINIKATDKMYKRKNFMKAYFYYLFNRNSYEKYIIDFVEVNVTELSKEELDLQKRNGNLRTSY